MLLEFNLQQVFTQSIQLDDIGNSAIRCSTDDGFEYYIITRTIMGKTMLLKFGPVIADMSLLISNLAIFYKKIDYKEASIEKELNKFINDPKKSITKAELITLDEAQEALPVFEKFFEDQNDILLDETI